MSIDYYTIKMSFKLHLNINIQFNVNFQIVQQESRKLLTRKMSKLGAKMTVEEAFQVLQLGFQWGCGEGWEDINLDNLTEDQLLQAFQEEVVFVGQFNTSNKEIVHLNAENK